MCGITSSAITSASLNCWWELIGHCVEAEKSHEKPGFSMQIRFCKIFPPAVASSVHRPSEEGSALKLIRIDIGVHCFIMRYLPDNIVLTGNSRWMSALLVQRYTGYNTNVWFTKFDILFFPPKRVPHNEFCDMLHMYIRSVNLLMMLKLCLLMNGIWECLFTL